MKKFLAIILALITCLSFTACGEKNKYDYTGEWEVLAYRDDKSNTSIAKREDSQLGELVVIESGNIAYEFDNQTISKDQTFTAEDKQGVYEGQVYDTTYKVYSNSLLPFGESLMVWKGPKHNSNKVDSVLLRRNTYKESFEPISSIVTGEGQDIVINLDALVGEYSSRLVEHNVGYNNCYAFSSKENKNDLSVTKDGDKIKFAEDGKTWEVADTELNVYLKGVGLKLVSGEEVMYITIMEVSETAICYVLNSNGAPDLKYDSGSVYNYGVLVKK